MLFVQRKLAYSAQILFEKPLKIVCLHAQKVQNGTYLVTKCYVLKGKMVNIMKNILPNINSYDRESLGKLIHTLTRLN
jgi:hypothetical protein